MLTITDELIKYLSQAEEKIDGTIIHSYLNAILSCGSKADAKALLAYYVSDPLGSSSNCLFEIFEKWGDTDFAEQIFTDQIANNRLKEEEFDKVLEFLGKLHYEPIKPVLIHYAFAESSDHYLQRSAVLGLLHFNCDEIEDLIRSKIEETYGKGLFPEFTPALVCKLKDRTETLAKLFESGRDYCSVDCNAGILLGFSLCGKEGLGYFKQALFDRHWEADSTSTGTVWQVYQGIRNLNISLIDLYKEIRTIDEPEKMIAGLYTLLGLIRVRIKDYSGDAPESFAAIYKEMFVLENEDDKLFDLARKFNLEDEVYELERYIELKLNEEQILKNCGSVTEAHDRK